MPDRERRGYYRGIEGIPNDIKEIGLAIMGFRTLEISTSCEIHIKEGHARQSKLMHAQVAGSSDINLDLWLQIINRKVSNQARALSIMGMKGAENISKYLESITAENIVITEALAAKEYFSYYGALFN